MSWEDEIRTQTGTEGRPRDDKERLPSASQGDKPQKEQILPILPSQTSPPPKEQENTLLLCKLPSLLYFHIIALATTPLNIDTVSHRNFNRRAFDWWLKLSKQPLRCKHCSHMLPLQLLFFFRFSSFIYTRIYPREEVWCHMNHYNSSCWSPFLRMANLTWYFSLKVLWDAFNY